MFSEQSSFGGSQDPFREEIRTLSGALKAQYDQANKEYEGNSKLPYF